MIWHCMAFVALYCSLSCECAADVEKRAVELGDNVTLHCDFTHLAETLWFGQRCHQTPFLILSVKTGRNGSLASKCLRNATESYIVEFNKGSNSISLNILNISESDLGLFYCVTMSGSMKYIGHGHLLYRERSNSTTTVVQPSPPSPERTREQCWVLLAAVCPVCVLVTALPLTACLCWLCYRRNGETCLSVMHQFRCKERGEHEASEDRVQEEDDGLHYATLDLPTRHKRSKTSPVQDQFNTYSAVTHKR